MEPQLDIKSNQKIKSNKFKKFLKKKAFIDEQDFSDIQQFIYNHSSKFIETYKNFIDRQVIGNKINNNNTKNLNELLNQELSHLLTKDDFQNQANMVTENIKLKSAILNKYPIAYLTTGNDQNFHVINETQYHLFKNLFIDYNKNESYENKHLIENQKQTIKGYAKIASNKGDINNYKLLEKLFISKFAEKKGMFSNKRSIETLDFDDKSYFQNLNSETNIKYNLKLKAKPFIQTGEGLNIILQDLSYKSNKIEFINEIFSKRAQHLYFELMNYINNDSNHDDGNLNNEENKNLEEIYSLIEQTEWTDIKYINKQQFVNITYSKNILNALKSNENELTKHMNTTYEKVDQVIDFINFFKEIKIFAFQKIITDRNHKDYLPVFNGFLDMVIDDALDLVEHYALKGDNDMVNIFASRYNNLAQLNKEITAETIKLNLQKAENLLKKNYTEK